MDGEADRPTDDDTGEQQRHSNQQSNPNQQAAARERRPPRRESTIESLSRPASKNQLKYTIGLFAEIGLGFGLTGFIILELIASGGELAVQFGTWMFSLALLLVTLLIGPVIAAFSGLRIAEGLREEARTVYLTSAVGNFVGYLVMVIITVLLIAATGGGGGNSIFDLGKLLVPLIALAIPVALVGAGTAYLHLNVGTDR